MAAVAYSSTYIPPHARTPVDTDKSNNLNPHYKLFLSDDDENPQLSSFPTNITTRRSSVPKPANTDTENVASVDPPHPTLIAMFDTLNNKMSDQVTRLKRMEVSFVNTNKSLDFTQENLKDLKAKVKDLESENRTLKNQNVEYHRMTRDLNRRVNDIEQQLCTNDHNTRRRNILVEGVSVTQGENTLDIAVDIISNIVPGFSHSEIEFTQRISKPGAQRPILVILKSIRLRDQILKNKQSLKQHPTLKKIWINEDANPTIKKQKNDSRAISKLATKKGSQAQPKGTGVIIDGVYYAHNKFDKLPGGIKLSTTRTRISDNTVGFAGPLAPLSNMHEAPFMHNNTPYRSVEQAHFHIIATDALELTVAQQILDTNDAFTARNLGKPVQKASGKEADVSDLKILMRKKYLQNPSLMIELLSTGTRRILECNWDKKWAAGHGLDSRLFETRDQPGENLTGTALEELRTEFKDLIASGQLQIPNLPPGLIPTPTNTASDRDHPKLTYPDPNVKIHAPTVIPLLPAADVQKSGDRTDPTAYPIAPARARRSTGNKDKLLPAVLESTPAKSTPQNTN